MQDPYTILGVSRNASQTEVKQSYRRLAKALHPDRQPGDSAAAERFKEISAAYHVLGDQRQRHKFDRGEIDANGNRRAPFKRPEPKSRSAKQRQNARNGSTSGTSGNTAQAGAHASTSANSASHDYARTWTQTGAGAGAAEAAEAKASFENFGFGGFSASDLFQPFFRHKRSTDEDDQEDGGIGKDMRYRLEIGLLDAIKGGKQRLSLKDDRDIFVTVPVGVENGQIIRLKGQGEKAAKGRAGDALVEISIVPHAYFTRHGKDIHMDLPVTVQEAVQGARIAVPTIDGPVTVTVPKASNAGTRLRLRGKGAIEPKSGTRGDQHLTLKVVLPEANDGFDRLVNDWSKDNDYDVRALFRDS